MKKFILNADDLGKTKAHNDAVLKALEFGLLKSASVLVNGEYFFDAVNRIITPNPQIGFALHLNIIEGNALNPQLNLLCDKKGIFNNNYLSLILKCNSKAFLAQVEEEFEAQIQKALNYYTPTHIDSHVHTHAIPAIFSICAKLMKKYGFKQIRSQTEIPYFVKNKEYNPINFIKVMLLNYFTRKNQKTIKKYNLTTNDYILGVNYTGLMDDRTIIEGLKKINKDSTVEALIHPCFYENSKKDRHLAEYELSINEALKEKIQNLGYLIVNYIN